MMHSYHSTAKKLYHWLKQSVYYFLSFADESLYLRQYTEANAVSKGVSIGVFNSPKKSVGEENQSQPYVDLMGRQVPVISRQDEQWRGVVKGEMVQPDRAYGYLQRSFRQQLGSVIGMLDRLWALRTSANANVGAMRLLAESFPPKELNEKGSALSLVYLP